MTEAALWYVYVLQMANGHYYVGMTSRLAERIAEHQSGHGPTTVRLHLPVELVWFEALEDTETARRVERWLKRRSVSEKLAYMQAHGTLIPPNAG